MDIVNDKLGGVTLFIFLDAYDDCYNTGTIPAELSQLSSLKWLKLTGNSLSGQFVIISFLLMMTVPKCRKYSS